MQLHDQHNPHDYGRGGDSLASERLDTPSQSLSEALHVSFRILKFVLIIVVVLYLGSGIQKLEQNEKALVLRLGELQPEARGPGGLVVTFPRPIDQLIKVPVTEKRTTTIVTQDLRLKENEERSSVRRSGGLDPKLDGSIMTGDRGLVHARWIVTYEISDLRKFVSNVFGAERGGEIELIEHAVENAAIEVIGRMDAVDVVRHKIGEIQRGVKRRAQGILTDLETGINIANIDALPGWPVQTKASFERVTKASNEKTKKIDEAKKRSTEILNNTAGAAHSELKDKFDEYLALKSAGDQGAVQAKMEEIEHVILNRATGQASQVIQEARSFKKETLEDIKADAMEYRAYLEEYKRNPEMLFSRLWYEAQEQIMANPKISKRHLPRLRKELRIIIGRDPEEKRAREEEELLKQERMKGDFSDVKRRRGRFGRTGSAAKVIR